MDISTNIKDIIPSLSKAIALARRETSVLVYEAVQLEGINMTLPEIQTLLDGVTVGGHKISDQQIALNQGDAWKALFGDVVGDVNKRMGRFMMNGVLLSHGYPVINVPAKRKLEFNELMLDFTVQTSKAR